MAIETYEEALVFAAKNGNTTSFEELYRLYYKKVYALIRMTIKDPAESEDVLQQTFVNAWKNISKLEDIKAFNTWIQRIAVNQCYSVLRRHKEMLTTDDEEQRNVMETLESEFMLPEVYATQQDLSGRLKKIISELSDVQRQTILLYYYNEMSVEEIAEVMDCSPGTVKSRLYLARKAIGTEIEEQERKSGQKFFAMAGIPLAPFWKIFGAQVGENMLGQDAAMQLLSRITKEAGFISKLAGMRDLPHQAQKAASESARNAQGTRGQEGMQRAAKQPVQEQQMNQQRAQYRQQTDTAQHTLERRGQQVSDYQGQHETAQQTFEQQRADAAQRTMDRQTQQASDYQGQRQTAQHMAEQQKAVPHLEKTLPRQTTKLGAGVGKTAAKTAGMSVSKSLGLKIAAIATAATIVVGGSTAGGVALVRNTIRKGREGKEDMPEQALDPTSSVVEVVDDEWTAQGLSAYLELLEDEEQRIKDYDWELYSEGVEEERPVAFCDLTGDGFPEMLYIACEKDNQNLTKLHVVTAADGQIEELIQLGWDYQVAGGMRYAAFTVTGERALYTIEMEADDFMHLRYVRHNVSKDGLSMDREILMTHDSEPVYENQERKEINTYMINGKEVSEEKFSKQVADLLGKADTLLLHSQMPFDSGMQDRENTAMTYEEAVNWLRGLLGMEAELHEIDPGELAPEARDFLLTFVAWYSDDEGGHEFDAEHPERSILTSVVQNAPCVNLYNIPGGGYTEYWGEQDPRNWWSESWMSYARFDGRQVDWAIKNIFHVSENDLERMVREAEDNRELYKDGAAEGDYYYYTYIGGIGDPFLNVEIETVKTDGEKFYVTYGEWFDTGGLYEEPEYITSYYAVIAYEQIDGEYYWTMYKHTSQIPEEETEDAPELFSMIAGDYTFTSGVGGWATGLRIQTDGTYTCTFTDWDYTTGEEYNAIVYLSSCHGRFGNPRKINEYTYAFDMEELIYDGKVGEERIVGAGDDKQLEVFTNAYGIAEAKTFYVYMPDAPKNRLPEEFLGWVQWNLDQNSDTLGFTGLYNINEKEGFYGE